MRYEDEVRGKGKQAKGAVKEKLGKLAGDRDLQDRGAADRTEGKVQEKFGKARGKSAKKLKTSAKESPANGEAGDSFLRRLELKGAENRMKQFLLLTAIGLSAPAFGACNNTESNMNSNANANSNMGMRSEATPAPTPTPKYTEEQAREERERAKANKETIGQSLEDAWIHTKIVAKLIGNTQTPERKINVDVVEGAVTLRGTVDTAEAKTEAGRIAKETDGVKKVTNQLKVVPAKATNTNKAANANTPGIKNKGKTP